MAKERINKTRMNKRELAKAFRCAAYYINKTDNLNFVNNNIYSIDVYNAEYAAKELRGIARFLEHGGHLKYT